MLKLTHCFFIPLIPYVSPFSHKGRRGIEQNYVPSPLVGEGNSKKGEGNLGQ